MIVLALLYRSNCIISSVERFGIIRAEEQFGEKNSRASNRRRSLTYQTKTFLLRVEPRVFSPTLVAKFSYSRFHSGAKNHKWVLLATNIARKPLHNVKKFNRKFDLKFFLSRITVSQRNVSQTLIFLWYVGIFYENYTLLQISQDSITRRLVDVRN